MHTNVNTVNSRSLFDLITAPLTFELRKTLWHEMSEKIEKYGAENAFHEVFTSLDSKKTWVWLQVDVRDCDEVQWQAEAIAKTWALPEQYRNFKEEQAVLVPDSPTLNAILRFDTWLSQFKKSFVLIESGDTYLGFVVPDDEIKFAIEALTNIGLSGQAIRQMDFKRSDSGSFSGGKNANLNGIYSILETAPINNDVIIVKITNHNELLKTIVAEHAKIALTTNRIPVVCLSASWCEPCQEMLIALHHENAKDVMKQLTIILLDIEDCDEYLKSINVDPKCVPLFFNVLTDGLAGELSVDGGAWDDAIPSVIAGVLRDTFKLK